MEVPEYVIKKRKVRREELENLNKEELINKIMQMDQHLQDLKNIIQKQNNCQQKKIRKGKFLDVSKCERRKVAIKLLYLGWNYKGFVKQEDTSETVECYLFDALKRTQLIESRESSSYHRCGRTDLGVSSFSQVISIYVRSRLSPKNMDKVEDEIPYCRVLNVFLPDTIRAVSWSPVSDDFNARFSCVRRTYKYWLPKGNLDIQAMNNALQFIIGEHDFRNLCKMDVANGRVNFRRRVEEASCKVHSTSTYMENDEFNICEVTLVGQAFLWHQVRAVLTVLFLVGKGKESPEIFKQLLDTEQCPRKPQYPLADPLPLNLFHCEFENVNWVVDRECILSVISKLESQWSSYTIKSTMVGEMLKECKKLIPNITQKSLVCDILFNDGKSRSYQPLMKRQCCKSLEDQIEHYVKKGRIQRNTDERKDPMQDKIDSTK